MNTLSQHAEQEDAQVEARNELSLAPAQYFGPEQVAKIAASLDHSLAPFFRFEGLDVE